LAGEADAADAEGRLQQWATTSAGHRGMAFQLPAVSKVSDRVRMALMVRQFPVLARASLAGLDRNAAILDREDPATGAVDLEGHRPLLATASVDSRAMAFRLNAVSKVSDRVRMALMVRQLPVLARGSLAGLDRNAAILDREDPATGAVDLEGPRPLLATGSVDSKAMAFRLHAVSKVSDRVRMALMVRQFPVLARASLGLVSSNRSCDQGREPMAEPADSARVLCL
jgi:hypothetical protein